MIHDLNNIIIAEEEIKAVKLTKEENVVLEFKNEILNMVNKK